MLLRNELALTCKRVYENKFVSAYDGNLSVRIDEKRILITPSAKCKGTITPEDLIEIDYDGNILSGYGKVSTEVKIHLAAYKVRKEINSVIHCHPVYATAFATAGESFTLPVFPEFILTIGKVPLCKYATPSTDELVQSLFPFINYANALLLENHGAVTLGTSITDAYYKMEKLEHTAKTLFVTRMIGREKTIPRYKLNELYLIAEETYGIKINKENKI